MREYFFHRKIWGRWFLSEKKNLLQPTLPLDTVMHNIEIICQKDGQFARAVYAVANLIAKEDNPVTFSLFMTYYGYYDRNMHELSHAITFYGRSIALPTQSSWFGL